MTSPVRDGSDDRGPDDRTDSCAAADHPSPVHASRQQLVWDVIRFQLKLVADGVMDLLLSPMAIAAALMGLMAGGDDPHRYFRRLLRFGRRVDLWLNLFGTHRRRGTADDVMDDLRERVFSEASSNPWLNRASGHMNTQLDALNAARAQRSAGDGSPQESFGQAADFVVPGTRERAATAPADAASRPGRQPLDS